MNCFACESNLSAYIDDELIADVRRAIETHLDTCESCRKAYEAHLAVWERAGNLRTAGAPDNLWKAVEAEIQSKDRGAPIEELALMVRGLAGEIRDLKRTVENLRRDMEPGAPQERLRPRAGQSLGIWTDPGIGRTRSDVG